ncbi:hypothetical protein NVR12_11605, partial [Staphylococcus pseudintermedius]|nr:hypothetical protein [Staphylococcus pseudintermedius]
FLQNRAYYIMASLVGSYMFLRDRYNVILLKSCCGELAKSLEEEGYEWVKEEYESVVANQ